MIPRPVIGAILAISAGLTFSSGGYFVRAVNMDAWEIIFLRCFFAAFSAIFIFVLQERKQALKKIKAALFPTIIIGIVTGWAIIAYVLALQLTLVANVIAIMTTSTIIVALLARPFLGEEVQKYTWFAMIGGLCGIGIMFSGNAGSGDLLGNLLAFSIAVAIAVQTLVARRFRYVRMEPAVALAAIIAGIIALPMALPLEASLYELGMMAAFGIVQLALPLTLYFYAARYLSAPTLIFVVLIDAVFAPIWVWLGFEEVPSRLIFIGASLILVSVSLNAGFGLFALKRHP